MKYELVVKAEAIEDMTRAFFWYENKRTGLGEEFIEEVEGFFDRIAQSPRHFKSHRYQRIAVMHRFPYKIVFEIESEAVIVYAIYHDKQDKN